MLIKLLSYSTKFLITIFIKTKGYSLKIVTIKQWLKYRFYVWVSFLKNTVQSLLFANPDLKINSTVMIHRINQQMTTHRLKTMWNNSNSSLKEIITKIQQLENKWRMINVNQIEFHKFNSILTSRCLLYRPIFIKIAEIQSKLKETTCRNKLTQQILKCRKLWIKNNSIWQPTVVLINYKNLANPTTNKTKGTLHKSNQTRTWPTCIQTFPNASKKY